MPTYEYRCHDCGEEFSAFVTVSKRGEVDCTGCGSDDVEQLVTAFYHHSSGSSRGGSSAGCTRQSCTTCPGCRSR